MLNVRLCWPTLWRRSMDVDCCWSAPSFHSTRLIGQPSRVASRLVSSCLASLDAISFSSSSNAPLKAVCKYRAKLDLCNLPLARVSLWPVSQPAGQLVSMSKLQSIFAISRAPTVWMLIIIIIITIIDSLGSCANRLVGGGGGGLKSNLFECIACLSAGNGKTSVSFALIELKKSR